MPHIYITEQGETLLSIAHKYNFSSWETIWNHERNRELRGLRPNPQVLYPGDRLYIPDKPAWPVAGGQKTSFRIKKRMTCRFAVYLKDEAGRPYAGNKYELTIGDDIVSDTTPEDGLVVHEVSPAIRQGTLKLWPNEDDENETITWELKIGHLDPPNKISGAQARLNNLGFDVGEVDGRMTPQTIETIKAFQRQNGIHPPSGMLDKKTLAALDRT